MAQSKAAGKQSATTKAGARAQKERTSGRSKAQQATSKTAEDLRIERRDNLILRLVVSLLLALVTLFLVLNMIGLQGVVLEALGKLFRGLLGYGFWISPLALGYVIWMLVFLHEEPVRGRIAATAALVVDLSALLHTLICRVGFTFGPDFVSRLWTTGTENTSGGVVPGFLSELLQSGISKGGTVPVLLLLLLVLVFVAFRLSAVELIHNRAEKRRELLSELEDTREEPEPQTYDTRADLRVLATPVPRAQIQAQNAVRRQENAVRRNRQRSYDMPLGKTARQQEVAEVFGDENLLPGTDEDILFTVRKPRILRKKRRDADFLDEFIADTGDDLFDEPRGRDYTREVQELVRQEQEETLPRAQGFSWEQEEPVRPDQPKEPVQTEIPDPLPELGKEEAGQKSRGFDLIWQTPDLPVKPAPRAAEPIDPADLEVTKEKKVSHGEAAQEAALLDLEITAQADAAAREEVKKVYQYPPMSMLAEAMESKNDNTEEMRTCVRRLEDTLESFGVDSKINNVVRGPAVTRYEMELRPGVKMSKITSLQDDIALALGVTSVHVAAVPGKSSTIGIEVPNAIVTSVPIKEVLSSREFRSHKSALAFAAGKDISGNYIIGDIAKMPHLLIAGTTGSGKSVCMNGIIVSLLYRDSPEQCRLIMIDPKVVELSVYNGIPHLLIPVVTDPKKAAGALQWAVTEMDRRYNRFETAHVRDLTGYNKKAAQDPELEPMPRIVVIIDELADLMMVAAKEVETSIARLAAKARAAGMHLVIATQRPSADVITGVIKANIPSRIAFAVSSAMESNIIMGTRGAEKLLGKGDMFYAPQGADKPKRVQGCCISDEEVEDVVEFVKNSSEADYSDDIITEIENNAAGSGSGKGDFDDDAPVTGDGDPQLAEAVEVLLDTKQASVSMLQRRMKLGYAHAARIMDELEEKGIVGPYEGSKPRQLLMTREKWAVSELNPRRSAGETVLPGTEDDVPFEED